MSWCALPGSAAHGPARRGRSRRARRLVEDLGGEGVGGDRDEELGGGDQGVDGEHAELGLGGEKAGLDGELGGGGELEREPVFPAGAWRYAKKRAKVADLRFHDPRHFWACRLLDHGATIPQLMVVGGWRSVVALRVYIARAQRQGSAPVEAMHARSLST